MDQIVLLIYEIDSLESQLDLALDKKEQLLSANAESVEVGELEIKIDSMLNTLSVLRYRRDRLEDKLYPAKAEKEEEYA